MLFKADPTFYPSPKLAMQAPREGLAYVAALNANGGQKPDAIVVVDVNAQSKTYGQIVGRVDMPNVGDELHHFGWNACSSALCPYAAHPHVERRYLLTPCTVGRMAYISARWVHLQAMVREEFSPSTIIRSSRWASGKWIADHNISVTISRGIWDMTRPLPANGARQRWLRTA